MCGVKRQMMYNYMRKHEIDLKDYQNEPAQEQGESSGS